MKHLITSLASVMLLMAFLTQFAQNQVLYQKLVMVNAVVDESAGDEARLKTEISQIMGCDLASVEISEEDDYVEVRFPMKNVLASPKFWGIEAEENTVNHVIRRGYSTDADWVKKGK